MHVYNLLCVYQLFSKENGHILKKKNDFHLGDNKLYFVEIISILEVDKGTTNFYHYHHMYVL